MGELTTPTISNPSADAPPLARSSWVFPVQCLVVLALTLWVFKVPIGGMVNKWQRDGNWSHGWLVPVFSLYFIAVRRSAFRETCAKGNLLGGLVVLGALGCFYYSLLSRFMYPQQLSLIPCLLGLTLLVGGLELLKHTWFPIAYLIFAVPLPGWLYFELTLPLRKLASRIGGILLGLLPDVYTDVQGVVIDYMYLGNSGALNVEEACSGMRLMMAFCALGVAMAYLGERPLWHRVLMVVSCVPIAVFCNTIRVFATGVLHVYGKEDLSQGTAHELLGLAMLPIALGLFALVGYILKHLFVEDDTPAESAA